MATFSIRNNIRCLTSLIHQTQRSNITVVPIQSHIKRKNIPPKIAKAIKKQEKLCDNTFEHTIKLSDWKKEKKLKQNIIDEEYEIDEKAVYEASSYDALVVGSENYGQQYPYIAYQNIMNIFNMTQRRLPTNDWKVQQSICTSFNLNILTPISFHNQLLLNKSETKKKKKKQNIKQLPFICEQSKPLQSISTLKDGSNRDNMPYFINNDNTEILIFRDIPCNLKTHSRILKVIQSFKPDSVIIDYNANDFKEFKTAYYDSNSYNTRNRIHKLSYPIIPSFWNLNIKYGNYLGSLCNKSIFSGNIFNSNAVWSMMHSLLDRSNSNHNINIIAGDLCNKYSNLLRQYSFLCDLFSMSAIELSPILPNKILPKKVKTISTKLFDSNSKLTDTMQYLIVPYFYPHLHLFRQIKNSYLMHCLYGCVNDLNSKRILMIVNNENVFDLITKLSSNDKTGYYFTYNYNSLFKEVNNEFVTMPSVLPTTYMRNGNVKLQDFEWKRLHSMFGLKFIEFLEHEIEMKQALVK